MLELRERVGLAREIFVGLDPLLLVDEMVDHLLDRAGAVGQALVVREVDHPHPAAAQQALDLIAVLQHRAGGERLAAVQGDPDVPRVRHLVSKHNDHRNVVCSTSRIRRHHQLARRRRKDRHGGAESRRSYGPPRARSARRCTASGGRRA